MGKTPEYTKSAVKKYNEKFDRITVNLEKGTRERIIAARAGNISEFVAQAIEDRLQKFGLGLHKDAKSDEIFETRIKTESEKRDALQAFIDAKRQEIAAAKKRAPGAVTEEDAKGGIGAEAKTDPAALFPTEIIHQNLETKKEM